MKEDKVSTKVCLECSKKINLKKDHYVLVETCNRLVSLDDLAYFHFQCFVDYFNKRVENKMKANVQMMQTQAVKLFDSPMIKNLLSQIQGSEIATNMLKTPLKVEFIDLNIQDKIREKIQDDRKRKRSAKKRKNKM